MGQMVVTEVAHWEARAAAMAAATWAKVGGDMEAANQEVARVVVARASEAMGGDMVEAAQGTGYQAEEEMGLAT